MKLRRQTKHTRRHKRKHTRNTRRRSQRGGTYPIPRGSLVATQAEPYGAKIFTDVDTARYLQEEPALMF